MPITAPKTTLPNIACGLEIKFLNLLAGDEVMVVGKNKDVRNMGWNYVANNSLNFSRRESAV